MSNVAAARSMLLIATGVTALFLLGCPPSPPSDVTVPNCVGMTQSAAEATITSARLTLGTVTEQFNDTVPAGQVITQNPVAGASVAEGSSVALVVSKGPEGGEGETIMLPGDVPLEMVWIPAGSFQMGRYPGEQDSYDSEDPQHPVTLSSGFWLGKYELTKAQWTAVMGTTPWSGQSYVLDHPDSPAVYVSWNDAQSFISALNTYTGLTFRLPSEAQWEYACRAGTTTRFYWGNDPSYADINDYAWWEDNAGDVGERYAHVVGLKLSNAFGLYDMSGNVFEWCEDDWHDGYGGAPADGSPWVDSPRGSYLVMRGGGWYDDGYDCRSALRYDYYLSSTSYSLGFRLAR